MVLNELNYLPIPAGLPQWRILEIGKYRLSLMNAAEVRLENNVRYWRSNDSVIAPFVYKDACVQCPKEQQDAYAVRMDQFAKDYAKKQQQADLMREEIKRKYKNNTPLNYAEEMLAENDSEEAFEMRAAFGEGAEVVNIFTGKKTKIGRN